MRGRSAICTQLSKICAFPNGIEFRLYESWIKLTVFWPVSDGPPLRFNARVKGELTKNRLTIRVSHSYTWDYSILGNRVSEINCGKTTPYISASVQWIIIYVCSRLTVILKRKSYSCTAISNVYSTEEEEDDFSWEKKKRISRS